MAAHIGNPSPRKTKTRAWTLCYFYWLLSPGPCVTLLCSMWLSLKCQPLCYNSLTYIQRRSEVCTASVKPAPERAGLPCRPLSQASDYSLHHTRCGVQRARSTGIGYSPAHWCQSWQRQNVLPITGLWAACWHLNLCRCWAYQTPVFLTRPLTLAIIDYWQSSFF